VALKSLFQKHTPCLLFFSSCVHYFPVVIKQCLSWCWFRLTPQCDTGFTLRPDPLFPPATPAQPAAPAPQPAAAASTTHQVPTGYILNHASLLFTFADTIICLIIIFDAGIIFWGHIFVGYPHPIFLSGRKFQHQSVVLRCF